MRGGSDDDLASAWHDLPSGRSLQPTVWNIRYFLAVRISQQDEER